MVYIIFCFNEKLFLKDVKIVAKSSNGSGKKLGGLHSHKLPENGTAADLRKNNVSVNANEDSYRESENPKVSEFGVESPKLAGILPVDLRSNGSGVFSVSSLKQNEKVRLCLAIVMWYHNITT